MGKRDNRVVSNAGSPAGRQRPGAGGAGRRWDPPQPRWRHLRAGPAGEAVGSWALPQPGQPHGCGGLGRPGPPARVLGRRREKGGGGGGEAGGQTGATAPQRGRRGACGAAGGRHSRGGGLHGGGSEGGVGVRPTSGPPAARQQRRAVPCRARPGWAARGNGAWAAGGPGVPLRAGGHLPAAARRYLALPCQIRQLPGAMPALRSAERRRLRCWPGSLQK